jgi:hypothetical protein
MSFMSIPDLLTRGTLLALLISAPVGALAPTRARAETRSAPAQMALISSPAANAVVLVDTPRRLGGDEPTAAPQAHSSWWPWALIAVGVVGVAALVITSNGGDPACPAGRVCQ